MVNHPNRIGKAKRAELVERAHGVEADRYFNNVRVVPVGDYIVTFSPGAEPVVEFDRFGAGPAMQQAAEAVPFDAYRDMAIDRIVARHRAYREAVAAFAR